MFNVGGCSHNTLDGVSLVYPKTRPPSFSLMFHTFYVEDLFPVDKVVRMVELVPHAVFHLRWMDKCSHLSPISRRFTIFDLVKEGVFDVMPRTRKPQEKPAANRGRRPVQQNDSQVTWVNCKLSDDDIAWLVEHPQTYEECGAMLLAVAEKGYNFSVKYMDDGESVMCAIVGYVDDAPTKQMGISAFAENSVDASVACLYKFDQLLGGSFKTDQADTQRTKPRFR